MTETVRYGQSIFDFCIWKYGTLQQVVKLCRDNNLNYDVDIYQGDILEYFSTFGNNLIKTFFETTGKIPVSNVENVEVLDDFLFEDSENYLFEDDTQKIFE
jgi:hypothetical protein